MASHHHVTIDPLSDPLADPQRARAQGSRELFLVHPPIDHLRHRWSQLATSDGDLPEFAVWATTSTVDDMSRSFARHLGIDWYRSRLDDVLAAFDEAWLVVRTDHLSRTRSLIGDVQMPPPPGTPPFEDLALDDDVRSAIERRHPGDHLLYRLAGWYEDRSIRRLRSNSIEGTT